MKVSPTSFRIENTQKPKLGKQFFGLLQSNVNHRRWQNRTTTRFNGGDDIPPAISDFTSRVADRTIKVTKTVDDSLKSEIPVYNPPQNSGQSLIDFFTNLVSRGLAK